MVLGGADAVDGVWTGAAQARAQGGLDTHLGPRSAWIVGASSVDLRVGAGPWDRTWLQGGLLGSAPLALGGRVWLDGSAAGEVLVGRAGVTGAWQRHRGALLLTAGPALFSDPVGGGLGATARLEGYLQRSARLSLGATLATDAWAPMDVPAVASLDGWARYTPAPRWTTRLGAGGSLASDPGTTPAWRALQIPAGGRSARAWGSVEARLWRGVGARVETSWEHTAGPLDLNQFRLLAGVAVRGRTLPPPPPPAPTPTHFALPAAEATAVAVVGEFSEWQPVALARQADGTWTLDLVLPPGVYRYSYLVDGVPVVPPEAERTEDDGFGGQNGILVVGGS